MPANKYISFKSFSDFFLINFFDFVNENFFLFLRDIFGFEFFISISKFISSFLFFEFFFCIFFEGGGTWLWHGKSINFQWIKKIFIKSFWDITRITIILYYFKENSLKIYHINWGTWPYRFEFCKIVKLNMTCNGHDYVDYGIFLHSNSSSPSIISQKFSEFSIIFF